MGTMATLAVALGTLLLLGGPAAPLPIPEPWGQAVTSLLQSLVAPATPQGQQATSPRVFGEWLRDLGTSLQGHPRRPQAPRGPWGQPGGPGGPWGQPGGPWGQPGGPGGPWGQPGGVARWQRGQARGGQQGTSGVCPQEEATAGTAGTRSQGQATTGTGPQDEGTAPQEEETATTRPQGQATRRQMPLPPVRGQGTSLLWPVPPPPGQATRPQGQATMETGPRVPLPPVPGQGTMGTAGTAPQGHQPPRQEWRRGLGDIASRQEASRDTEESQSRGWGQSEELREPL